MLRTFTAVLFGFSLLVQATVSNAGPGPYSSFVKSLGEAQGKLIWGYHMEYDDPRVVGVSYADGVSMLNPGHIDAYLVQRGIFHLKCGPHTVVQPLQCQTTSLNPPAISEIGEISSTLNRCSIKYAAHISAPTCMELTPYGVVDGNYYLIDDPCAVPDLKPKPTDACSVALETGRGLPVPATACPTPSVMTDPNGEACLKGKLAVLGIPYAGPTATIRTAAYQAHLKDVWDRNEEHKKITDPAKRLACTAKREIVEGEMNHHGLRYQPTNESRHVAGKAFDISQPTVRTLETTLNQAGRSVSGLLRSPPPCTLIWGGTYSDPDDVHFNAF